MADYTPAEKPFLCIIRLSTSETDEDMWKYETLTLNAGGWIAEATASPTGNYNDRPEGTNGEITLLVIHNISLPPGIFGSSCVEELFSGKIDARDHPSFESLRGVHVSSHLFIRRTGEIVQFVPFGKRAWHAGKSSFKGRDGCNDFSIGIELEGSDYVPFEDAQYKSLALAANLIMRSFPSVTADNIAGHSDIAPGRKTDPGPYFDWHKFRCCLSELSPI